MFARRYQPRPFRIYSSRPIHKHRTFPNVQHETDAHGIPVRPTWSVNELLSSYPKPTLSSPTLTRLHELSALLPPAQGTQRHESLKQEMEDLIKLVEAVKLVDTTSVQPRQQHGAENLETNLDQRTIDIETRETSGEALLQHAARTSHGFYAVDADKRR